MTNRKTHRAFLQILAVFLLFSCSATEQDKSHVEDYLANELTSISHARAKPLETLPDEVANALINNDSANSQTGLFEAEKYDISAASVQAKSFFAGLVQDTAYSVAIHPDVDGLITIDLKQVTLDEVFALTTDIYGFHVEKSGTIFRVFPAGLRTETFSVNYLMMQRDGNTQTSIISGGVSQAAGGNGAGQGGGGQFQNNFSGNSANGNNFSGGGLNGAINGTSISTRSEVNFWENLETSLMAMVGNQEGRSVMISPQAGLISVRAMPSELKTIREFLQSSEESLTRQVVIEARILEVELDDEFQQGINWSRIAANIGSTDLTFSNTNAVLGNTISSALGGIANLSFTNNDFSGVLNLLSTQGNVQVLSSPRVTAINNQKAVIKVGDDEYFVTDISSQNNITPIGNSIAGSIVPDIELTPFFSGIALDVTPQIDENGSILLHIHPSVIETEEQEKVVTLNQQQIILPLAQSTIRESDTIIRANSGEIVVIGGLMQSVNTEEVSKTPLLGDVPVLGNLFKNRRDRVVKKELIILLKPTVVGPDTWRDQLENSRAQMADWLYVE